MVQSNNTPGPNFNELLAEDLKRHFPAFIHANEIPLRNKVLGMRAKGVSLEEARDIVQSCFADLYIQMRGWTAQEIQAANLEGYLYRIAHNRIKKQYNDQKRYIDPSQLGGGSFLANSTGASYDILEDIMDSMRFTESSEEVFLQKEGRQMLLMKLKELPEEHQKVVQAHLEGYKFREIAKHYGLPRSTVASICKRSVARLRLIIQRNDT